MRVTCFLTWSGIDSFSIREATDEGAGDRAPGVLLLTEEALYLFLPSRPVILVLRFSFPLGRASLQKFAFVVAVVVVGGVAEV